MPAVPHEGTHQTNGYASASPCTDGERVYAHFGSRGLHACTIDGDQLWSRDFGDMTIRAGFGEGSSPTVVGDRIIVPWDHEGPSKLFALDTRTGTTVWEVDRDESTCWATPLVVADADGTTQIVMNGETAARGDGPGAASRAATVESYRRRQPSARTPRDSSNGPVSPAPVPRTRPVPVAGPDSRRPADP
ncbi:MAG: PQQ-binding-like beta-propeller repeat protein [Pirellulales bacterium]